MDNRFILESKKYYKAEKFLKDDINRDGEVDFDDFKSFYKLIETYIRMDEPSKITDVVGEIKKIIPSSDEMKKNISWEFNRLGGLLYEIEMYVYAEILFKVGYSVYKDDQLKDMIDIAKKYKLVNNLMNDENVIIEIKGLLLQYFYNDKLDNQTRNQISENLNVILNLKDLNGINICLNSVSRLKKYYSELYKEKCESYSELESILSRKLKVYSLNGLHDFANESQVPKPLINAVYWILKENEEYFEIAINDIGKLNKRQIINGINYIKRYYPDYYKETSGFIDNLENAMGG